MEKFIVKLFEDFPGHVFEVRKGMFGQQLLVDGTIVSNTWDLGTKIMNDANFAEQIKGMTTEDSMYFFLKEKVENYFKSKQ